MSEVFSVRGEGMPVELPSKLAFAANLEKYFNALLGTVPRQTFNTYENFAREYLRLRALGKNQTEILRSLQASALSLGANGDGTMIAATVVSAGRDFIDRGITAVSPSAPSIKEIISDYGKEIVPGINSLGSILPWYLNPWLVAAASAVLYFGPGALARYQRNRRK